MAQHIPLLTTICGGKLGVLAASAQVSKFLFYLFVPNFNDEGALVVGRGYHIALTRDHAKRLFGQKDDETLLVFLEELKNSPEMKKGGRILETGTYWDAIHRCLTDGELDPTGGDFPANSAVLGGKQLHKGDDYAAVLIRPDMTNFIAEALGDLTQKDFRAKFFGLNPQSYTSPIGEKEFTALWLAVQNLKVFFDAAAENMEAVVFTAKYRE